MSRFLRNIIAAARDAGSSMQPQVASMYADLGGDYQDAAPEPLIAQRTASARNEPDDLAAPDSRRDVPRAPRRDEPSRMAAPLDPEPGPPVARRLAELADEPVPAPFPTPGAPRASAHSTPLVDAATAWARAHHPRAMQSARESAAPLSDAGGVLVDDAAHALQPIYDPPISVAAPRTHLAPASSARRQSPRVTQGSRPDTGRSVAANNDVEIHIGRIEVIAGSPTPRAPPKVAHKSPSLGDYLNGRRRSRP